MMTQDGLIFEANSLKQGRLQALTRQQLQAQATQNRERRWVPPTSSSSLVRNAIGNRDWRSAAPSGCCPSRPVVGRTSPRASLLWHHLFRYTDPIIDNDQGCVEITPGSALFPPAV